MGRVDEKRGARRTTAIVPVTCRMVSGGTSALPSQRGPGSNATTFTARTVNVSEDGILINCDVDILQRARLELSLKAPADDHVIRVEAEVAWSRKNSINLFGRYAAGLRIVRIDDRDHGILKSFFA
jgi:hypothetical protein